MRNGVSSVSLPPSLGLDPPLLGRVRTWEMVAEKINHGFKARGDGGVEKGGNMGSPLLV